MANQNIVKFIREQMAAGFTEAQVRDALKAKNWPDSEIDSAFFEAKNQQVSSEIMSPKFAVNDFIKESWEIYKKFFSLYLNIMLRIIGRMLLFVVPIIALFVVGRILHNRGIGLVGGTLIAAVLLGIAFVVVLLYFVSWLQAALILSIKRRNETQTPEEVIGLAKPLVWPYFATTFLTGLFTGLWFLLLVIPGIIFGIYYSFSRYITVDQGVAGYSAIKLSKRYVEGYWWQVAVSLLGLLTIFVLVVLVESALTKIFGQQVGAAIRVVVNFLSIPYALIYTFLVYEKLKQIKPELKP